MSDVPDKGLAFLVTTGDRIVIRAGVTAHFELLLLTAGSDEWATVEAWVHRHRPRFGRVGLRGGRLDVLSLTKPMAMAAPASEEEPQETDIGVIATVLARVLSAIQELS